jgi:hypothetical protein
MARIRTFLMALLIGAALGAVLAQLAQAKLRRRR